MKQSILHPTRAASSPDVDEEKGRVRKLVNRLQRGIRRLSHPGHVHHPKAHHGDDALIHNAHVAVPIAFPSSSSPKSKPSYYASVASSTTTAGAPRRSSASFLSRLRARSLSLTSPTPRLSRSRVLSSSALSIMGDSSSNATFESAMTNLPPPESETVLPAASSSTGVPPSPEHSQPAPVDDQPSGAHMSDSDRPLDASNPDHAIAEPEVPDPFLQDPDDETSSEAAESVQDSSVPEAPAGLSLDVAAPPLTAADEVSLAQAPPPTEPASTPLLAPAPAPSAPASPLPTASPSLAKSIHPPPPRVEDDDEDEDEVPELYLPTLTALSMFLPIPNTDPLTTLLTKYIPPERRPVRDVSGNWQGSDFNMLVMGNSWRALAQMARDRIVAADPEDLDLVLSLWYLRLACLARLRLFAQVSTECTNLYNVLDGVEPPAARAWLFARKVPFELDVLHARLTYWAGEHMDYLDALAGLLRRCKTQARAASAKGDAAGTAMWQERGARVTLIIASQLIEMRDFAAAATLLEPLCRQPDGTTAPHLQSAVARVYVQAGYVSAAVKHFDEVAKDPTADAALKSMNEALLATVKGNWDGAVAELRKILAADPENFAAINNLSVALLSQGKIQESIRVLEEAIQVSPSTTLSTEPLLFNLSTMYELRSATGVDKKRNLLVEVAKWAGDGLRITCLKMPTS